MDTTLVFEPLPAPFLWALLPCVVRVVASLAVGGLCAGLVWFWSRVQGAGVSGRASVLAMETFHREVLHDFLNRLRNRYPDDPERYLARMASQDMRSDLEDFLHRRLPAHAGCLRQAPGAHGLRRELASWDDRLADVQAFLGWAAEAREGDFASPEGREWLQRLDRVVGFLERVQAAILACVADATLDVGDVVEEVDGLYSEVTVQVGAGLKIRPEAVAPARDGIKSVLTNLVDNALNAGATAVQIVAERAGDDAVRILVADDGPGLSPAEADRIFETGVGQGTGTGLARAREVVAGLGGSIAVGRLEEGRGASFVVTLPRRRDGEGGS